MNELWVVIRPGNGDGKTWLFTGFEGSESAARLYSEQYTNYVAVPKRTYDYYLESKRKLASFLPERAL